MSMMVMAPANPLTDWLSDASDSGFNAAIARAAEDSWTFMSDAFAASDLSPAWWAGVVGAGDDPGMLRILTVVMAPLLILLVGYQATAGLFTGNTAMILRAGGMALLALPLLLGLVTVVMLFASAFDQGTQFILSASGESQNMAGFMKLFGFELNDSGEFQQMNSEYNVWRGVAENSSGFELLIPMVLSFVIWLASLFLGFMMALRTTALVMLTAMAAVAVFALSSDATKAWFFRWLSMVFGLLIAKPLSAAALVMAISVFRYSATTAQLLAALAAVIIAAIMPVAMMALFSFSAVQASGGLEAAMSRSSGSLMRNSGRGAGAMTRLIRR